ncbi:MAG: hypothetical protein HFH93_12760 [Lachnospiraceae bacterium]|nr:hypothetical protein [Lachnospiraceae bacterium]
MKYKKSVMAVLLVSMLGFSGCAENQIPDMTEEEMQAVGEFVAYTLTKYDVGHGSRLMDLPPEEDKVPAATPAPEPAESTEPAETEPTEETPVTEAPGAELEDVTNYTAEEVMGLPEGVTLTYAGLEICDSYPGESDAFAVTATEGKKLLVLKFSITNTLDQEARVDLLSTQTTYKISVDGERSRRAFTTMLPNDMAFYADTLSAGAGAEAVLVTEIDAEKAESVASVTVQIKNESKTHTIQLTEDV